ncbi:hypothetical protein ES703_28113 [subsurface metagenome]
MAITVTEEQLQYTSAYIIGEPPSWPGRVGQCLPIPGRRVTKLGFWLSKYRYPTGTIAFAIYRVSDGALLASEVWGDAAALPAVLDPAELVSSAIYYEVTLAAPADIDEEVYIVVDYTSTFMDGSNNLWVMIATADVKPDEYLVSRIGIWSPTPDQDCAYIYTYEVPLAIATNPATAITYNKGVLVGYLTDDGALACDVRFQWGRTTAYGNDTAWQTGKVTGNTITQEIGGLLENTLYHFRVQGRNTGGTVSGSDMTFVTSKASKGKGYALARYELIKSLIAYEGIASADGSLDGATLVDANLIGRNDFITNKTILIISGDASEETKGAILFDNTTGTITVDVFSAQITAGTIFWILNISSTTGIAEPSATGATTGAAYIDALDIDARLYNEFTIKIKNTDAANSLDYRVLLRPEHGVDEEMIQPEDITLAPTEYDFVNIDHKWGQVIVQVRDTVPDSNADFSVYVICNKQ